MKLFTKEIQTEAKKFPLYSQENKGDKAMVWAKYFMPTGRYTAYVTEMTIEALHEFKGKQAVEGSAFGYCLSPFGSDCDEWGYFDLNEWNEVKGPMGLGIERDMYWTPMTVGELKAKLDERGHA